MKRHIFMFQPRFAPLVKSGQKRQTIRPYRKYPPRAGDAIQFRAWSGRAYRSPVIVLGESIITDVSNVKINNELIWVGRRPFWGDEQAQFAIADGFAHSEEMLAWFDKTHGLPFEGILVKWK